MNGIFGKNKWKNIKLTFNPISHLNLYSELGKVNIFSSVSLDLGGHNCSFPLVGALNALPTAVRVIIDFSEKKIFRKI